MNLASILSSMEQPLYLLQSHIHLVLSILLVIWAVNLVNWFLFASRLNVLGIYPRHPFGLLGIIFSPILHGNFKHLFFNTIPMAVLLAFMLLSGVPDFIIVTSFIVLVGGLLTWLFGRTALHIGMSGVIFGYFGFLLVSAYERPSVLSIVLAAVVFYYFGSVLMGLFPKDKETSWEGHAFGFAAGIVAAIYYVPLLQFGFRLYSKY